MDIDKLKDLMGRVTPGPWLREAQNVYGDDGRWMVGKALGNDWPTTEANADLFAMAPDLATEVIRLTAENAQLVAANQALATENARLVKRDAVARRLIGSGKCTHRKEATAYEWWRDARAFLAGEVK